MTDPASSTVYFGPSARHWITRKARRLFSESRLRAKQTDVQLAATQEFGVIPQADFMQLKGQQVMLALGGTEHFIHADVNDFIISLRAFEGGIERCHSTGCVSPAYTVLQPSRDVDARFFTFLLKSIWFISVIQSCTTGIREGKTITYSQFASVDLPLPTLLEQGAIADFLIRETAEADALVAKYERLIELLEEKRVAIITQAVTKGLNPNIPMKDTGVQIIGDVPEHWAVLPLRRLASVRGGTGIPEDYLTDDESAIPFFKVGDIESADADGVMRNARSFVISSVPESAAGTWFPKDTIVLAKRGAALLLNRFRQTGQNGFFDSNLMGLKVDHKKLNLRFALHVLSIVDLVQYVKPGAIPSIDAPEIKNQVIALPPVQEQTLIVNHIEVWTRNIAIEISLVQRAVALVKEHRSVLITAAVTGQIDIRTYRSKKQPVGVSA